MEKDIQGSNSFNFLKSGPNGRRMDMEKSYSLIFGFIVVLALCAIPLEAASDVAKFEPPSPKYDVRVERSVMVPMRDRVRLSTDLYFPVGLKDKTPSILIRTPYNKNQFFTRQWGPSAYVFASQGYVVAVQDCRGKYESEGTFMVSINESDDGYDTLSWLAAQSWCNGNIGTYGCSYLGEVQILQSKLRHPNLKAMIPMAAGMALGTAGDRYRFFSFNGGALELAPLVGWFYGQGSKVYFRPPPHIDREEFLKISKLFDPAPKLPPLDFKDIWRSLPVVDMMKKAGAPPTDFEDCVSHGPGDPWWQDFGYITETDRFDVPTLHVNSWYDYGVTDTLYFFNLFQRNAESARCRDNQYVIIAPTTHCVSEMGMRAHEQTIVGERAVGDARYDYWNTYLRWFDFWLKGIENDITEMPHVRFYVLGKNEWRTESEWPPAGTKFIKYFLHSDGYANSRFGKGKLGTNLPGNESPDRFVYDPKTPVPSVGGPVCCTGTPDAPPGAFDQSEVETRHDILVYSSPVLEEGIEVSGPLQVVLYVSSSAMDSDFTGKLVDVYPDGTAFNVQEGILRARYREGFDKKVLMKAGEVYEIKIDLHSTSNYFGPGHRIRVEVSSSNFPRFDRNLNTGGNNYDETEWVIAKNTIHHSKKYPSYILLPVVPQKERT